MLRRLFFERQGSKFNCDARGRESVTLHSLNKVSQVEFRARTFEKSLLCSLRHFYARYDTFVPAGQKTIILVQFFGYKRGNRACITKTDILHLTIVVKSRDIQGVPFELTPPPPFS